MERTEDRGQRTEDGGRKPVGAGLVSARVEQNTRERKTVGSKEKGEQKTEPQSFRTSEARKRRPLDIGYSLLDIGHSLFVF